ncbi:MAG TPA: DoxX family membrane protein [Planctomycetes bacterium]|nr:DoxX family membrane protein [Planctomycetota bacterium]
MKKQIPTAARILLGLMFTGAAVAGMMGKVPPPEPVAAQTFMGVMVSSGLLYLVKILELVCGVALLSGFFVPLALLVLAPIIVNIGFFHLALDPSASMVVVVMITLWAVTASAYRPVFTPLLRPR